MPDVLEIELRISEGNTEVVLGKTRQNFENFAKEIEGKSPTLKFKVAGESFIDLDKLEKRAEQTRISFEAITRTRLDSGNIGNLTQQIVKSSERARQLATDISGIKKELANPNRKSSVAFLTEELKAAMREADSLNRKLNGLTGGAPVGLNGRGAANNLKLSGFQKTNLSYQVNDVLTGLASGQNPTQILAQQGGQIGQIFSKEQIVGFTAAYGGLVSILGLGTLAIAATYKITGDIRAEAERRLKAEEMITGAINRQRIAQRDAFLDLQKERTAADRNQNFSQFLKTDDIEALKRRRDLILQLVTPNASNSSLVPAALPSIENGKVVQKANESFLTLKKELFEVEARIKEVPTERNAQSLKSFEQRNEEFKKAQQNAIDYEKKRNEETRQKLKEFEQDVEKGKNKVKELEKTALSAFDNLSLKLNSTNPFVQIFSDADKSLKELRENIKTLPPDLRKVAEAAQQKINLRQLLSANLDNQLSTFDLRSDAANFRNPFDGEKQKKDQDEFVQRFLQNNPNYLFTQNKNALDDETRSGILKRFAPSSLNETPASRFNKALEEKQALLFKPGQTLEQQQLADKKFISLTAGANPLDLSKSLRESAALVREREAIRQEKYQQEAITIYRDQLKVQEAIAANTAAQNKIAEKGGSKAIELTLKDETAGGRATLKPAATSTDVAAAYYDPDLNFSSSGGFSNR